MIKVVVVLMLCLAGQAFGQLDYGQALTKSLLFFEAQRSGKLPGDQKVTWRGDSALRDGSEGGVRLKSIAFIYNYNYIVLIAG